MGGIIFLCENVGTNSFVSLAVSGTKRIPRQTRTSKAFGTCGTVAWVTRRMTSFTDFLRIQKEFGFTLVAGIFISITVYAPILFAFYNFFINSGVSNTGWGIGIDDLL